MKPAFFDRRRWETVRLKTCFPLLHGIKFYVDYLWDWCDDGFGAVPRIGAIAIVTVKVANDQEFYARTAANVVNIALESGASFEALRASVTRDSAGAPLDMLGHALDLAAEDFGRLRDGLLSSPIEAA